MSKNVYEISIKFKSNDIERVDCLRAELISSGIKEKDIIEFHQDGKIVLSLYKKLLRSVKALQTKVQSFGVNKKNISIKLIKEKEWVDVWKDSFKPFKLTDNLKIVPIWEKDKYLDERKKSIFIDTKLAFGTGLHETTRFTAQLIERCSGKFKSFFDIGTGTGILAMVALKNGAQDIFAVDIEDLSIRIAKENLKNNDYTNCILKVLDIKDLRSNKKYDFVAANLITHDLIRLGKKIVSFVRNDGYLVVSGVSIENLSLLKETFSRLPLRCLKIEKGKKWAAILYKKIK